MEIIIDEDRETIQFWAKTKKIHYSLLITLHQYYGNVKNIALNNSFHLIVNEFSIVIALNTDEHNILSCIGIFRQKSNLLDMAKSVLKCQEFVCYALKKSINSKLLYDEFKKLSEFISNFEQLLLIN